MFYDLPFFTTQSTIVPYYTSIPYVSGSAQATYGIPDLAFARFYFAFFLSVCSCPSFFYTFLETWYHFFHVYLHSLLSSIEFQLDSNVNIIFRNKYKACWKQSYSLKFFCVVHFFVFVISFCSGSIILNPNKLTIFFFLKNYFLYTLLLHSMQRYCGLVVQ